MPRCPVMLSMTCQGYLISRNNKHNELALERGAVMYLLAELKALEKSNRDLARDLTKEPKFIASAQRVFDTLAELDLGDLRTFFSKIHTHELLQLCSDPTSNLIEQSEDPRFSNNRSRITKTWNHACRPTSKPSPSLQTHSVPDTEIESRDSSQTLPLSSPPSIELPLSASTDTLPTTSQLTSPSAPATSISTISTTIGAPQPSPSSSSRYFHDTSSTPPLCDVDEVDTDPDSPVVNTLDSEVPGQQDNIQNPKRWRQAIKVMTLTFGSLVSVANLTKVIYAGNGLVRNDAISFLRGELLQWKGMWDPSDQHALLSDDSITDHFVKISQTISILDERSVMDRIRLLLYRVLLYQYYVRIQFEVKESKIQKQQGVGIASYAVEFLLKHLYDDYLNLADKKKRRKRLLHRQIRLGKRLTIMSGYLGLGILLSASDEAMMLINNTKFSDDMHIALVCYAANIFPELPRIGKALGKVVRHMVQNQPSEELRPYVESLLPDIQGLLDSERNPLSVSTLARFDQDVRHVEILEVFSEAPNPQGQIRRPRTIEVDLHASRKRCRSS